jgi:hypothetical protein
MGTYDTRGSWDGGMIKTRVKLSGSGQGSRLRLNGAPFAQLNSALTVQTYKVMIENLNRYFLHRTLIICSCIPFNCP